jgi:hypothetical protein
VDYLHVLADGGSVTPGAYYHVRPDRGVLGIAEPSAAEGAYRGEHLLSLAAEQLDDAASLAAARRLLRAQLDASLEGRALASRAVARALRARAADGRESNT